MSAYDGQNIIMETYQNLPGLIETRIKEAASKANMSYIQYIKEVIELHPSLIYRLVKGQKGLSPETATKLNRVLEVGDFKPYNIDKSTGEIIPYTPPKNNHKANEFKVGDYVMYLATKDIKQIAEVRFAKASQEWIYKFVGEAGLISERYIKAIEQPEEPTTKEEFLEMLESARQEQPTLEPISKPIVEPEPKHTVNRLPEPVHQPEPNKDQKLKTLLINVITQLIEML